MGQLPPPSGLKQRAMQRFNCANTEGMFRINTIAGDARKALEAKSGKPVLSKDNYLIPPVAAVVENAEAVTPFAKRKAISRPKKADKGKA